MIRRIYEQVGESMSKHGIVLASSVGVQCSTDCNVLMPLGYLNCTETEATALLHSAV